MADVDHHFNKVYRQNPSLQLEPREVVAHKWMCEECWGRGEEQRQRAAALDAFLSEFLHPDCLFFLPLSHDRLFLQGINGSFKSINQSANKSISQLGAHQPWWVGVNPVATVPVAYSVWSFALGAVSLLEGGRRLEITLIWIGTTNKILLKLKLNWTEKGNIKK